MSCMSARSTQSSPRARGYGEVDAGGVGVVQVVVSGSPHGAPRFSGRYLVVFDYVAVHRTNWIKYYTVLCCAAPSKGAVQSAPCRPAFSFASTFCRRPSGVCTVRAQADLLRALSPCVVCH